MRYGHKTSSFYSLTCTFCTCVRCRVLVVIVCTTFAWAPLSGTIPRLQFFGHCQPGFNLLFLLLLLFICSLQVCLHLPTPSPLLLLSFMQRLLPSTRPWDRCCWAHVCRRQDTLTTPPQLSYTWTIQHTTPGKQQWVKNAQALYFHLTGFCSVEWLSLSSNVFKLHFFILRLCFVLKWTSPELLWIEVTTDGFFCPGSRLSGIVYVWSVHC